MIKLSMALMDALKPSRRLDAWSLVCETLTASEHLHCLYRLAQWLEFPCENPIGAFENYEKCVLSQYKVDDAIAEFLRVISSQTEIGIDRISKLVAHCEKPAIKYECYNFIGNFHPQTDPTSHLAKKAFEEAHLSTDPMVSGHTLVLGPSSMQRGSILQPIHTCSRSMLTGTLASRKSLFWGRIGSMPGSQKQHNAISRTR